MNSNTMCSLSTRLQGSTHHIRSAKSCRVDQQAGGLWFYMGVEVNNSGEFDIVSSMLLLLLSPLLQGHNDCTVDREIYGGLQISSQKIPQMFAVMQT